MPAARSSWLSRRSLRTRIILGVLAAVIVVLWMATFSIGQTLRRDMEATISAQQYSVVSLMAQQVDRSLRERLAALEALALATTPATIGDGAALQGQLEQQVGVMQLFNWGIFVLDGRGVAVASVPAALDRGGVDYHEVPFIREAFAGGVAIVSDPLIGLRTGQPVVAMAVPVRDAEGGVAGLVVGATNLARPNFLDEISTAKFGRTGDFLVTAPRRRLFVASSDKTRLLKNGPPRGVNPVYDSYIDGYDGSGIARSSRGVVELSSSRRIPTTGWLMQSVLPTEEAFAPIRAMRTRLAAISLVLSLVAGAVAAWWLRRELGPLTEAATRLARMRDGTLAREPLPIRREDEIGELARAFNGLLEVIVAEEARAAEHLANARLRKIVARVPGVVFQYRRDGSAGGHFVFASDAVRELFGMSPEEVQDDAGRLRALLHPQDEARFLGSLAASAERLEPWRVEFRICPPGAALKWLHVDAQPEAAEDGAIVWSGAITDVTAAKAMEAELRIAAVTFESQEGILITDAERVIVRVNRAFTAITGYTEAEAVGRTPSMLKSGRHDAAFYNGMWAALGRDGYWRGEIWNRRRSGELYAEWATITAVRDPEGRITHYVGTFTDITEHKLSEERIHRLAFYDPLTGLPNRRLFHDRLDQAMAAAARAGSFGALLFLDLDQFKSLNDREGHVMGDALLVKVARRLSQCVRASDTVARLGGDEFVVILHDLAANGKGEAGARVVAYAVAEKIRSVLGEPYVLGPASSGGAATVHRCTVSIGICLFQGEGESRDEVIRRADVAMYAAKSAGRDAIRFFETLGRTATDAADS